MAVFLGTKKERSVLAQTPHWLLATMERYATKRLLLTNLCFSVCLSRQSGFPLPFSWISGFSYQFCGLCSVGMSLNSEFIYIWMLSVKIVIYNEIAGSNLPKFQIQVLPFFKIPISLKNQKFAFLFAFNSYGKIFKCEHSGGSASSKFSIQLTLSKNSLVPWIFLSNSIN